MESSSAKLALVPLVLAATWATARADATLTTTFTPPTQVGGVVDHVRLFAEDYTPSNYNNGTSVQDPPGTYIAGSAVLGPDLGRATNPGGAIGTTTVSYAPGTSAYAGLIGTIGTNQLILTSNGLDDIGADKYLSSGTNFSDAFAAVTNGTIAPLLALYGDQERTPGNPVNGFYLQNFDPGLTSTQPLNAYVFTQASNGAVTNSGPFSNSATLTVTPPANPVPEPASAAALGLGALGLLRRRRKLA